MPMNIHLGTLVNDFISSNDVAKSEHALTQLLSAHAEPLIRRILKQRLIFGGFREQQEVDDLCSEALSELLYRLRRMKDERSTDAIENFSSYTSVTTYRVYSEYLRWKYPRRHRLKTQLRYLLQSDGRFELWETDQRTWLCAVRRESDLPRPRRVLSREEGNDLLERLPRKESDPGDFIARILTHFDAAIEFNDLVGIVAELWGIHDHAAASLEDSEPASPREYTHATAVELRNWLAHLWNEVCELPLAQRHALLLNLRDDQGGPALALVPLAGIASIKRIAGVLEMPEADLASLWHRLPIDDLQIAERLCVTRQQVINLRKSARARLSRRMSQL